MASIERYTYDQTIVQLNHDTRVNPESSDIDTDRSKDNYSVTPGMNIPQEEQFDRAREVMAVEKARLDKALVRDYIYNMNRQIVSVGTVVPIPEEAQTPENEVRFVRAVTEFLEEKIGTCIAAHVHVDEENHHLHLLNIPEVAIDHEAIEKKVAASEVRGSKSRIPLALREKTPDGSYRYDKKVNYDELVGGVKGRIREAHTGVHEQNFMETFHHELQEYLKKKGVPGTVVFKPEGSERHLNIPVSLLKDYSARTGREIDRETLKDLTVDKVIDALEKTRERDAWGHQNTWERSKTWDREY